MFIVCILLLAARVRVKYVEVPAEPQIVYVEKEVEKKVVVGEKPYYAKIADSITNEEIDLLAKLVYEEARNQSLLGQRAVVEVVLNRIMNDRFPDTVKEVIYQDSPVVQFSTAYKLKNTKPTKEQYEAVQMVLKETVPILPRNVLFFSRGTGGRTPYEKIGDHYFCY